jgi:hypothetical protein
MRPFLLILSLLGLNLPLLGEVSSTGTPTVTLSPTWTLTSTRTPSATPTPTSTPSNHGKPTPTDSFKFGLDAKVDKPDVTVIPNPAWGAKLSFRVMVPQPALVRIRVYDHSLEPFDKIEQEGEKVFDILWSLKNVPQGLYYYQVQIVDQASGNITKLPLTNFAVMK